MPSSPSTGLISQCILVLGCHPIISPDRRELQPIADQIQAEETRLVRNGLRWENRPSCLSQSVPVGFQILHHETDVPMIGLVGSGWAGQEVQFHLTLPGGKPDEMEMGQGALRLFLLQPEDLAIEGAHCVPGGITIEACCSRGPAIEVHSFRC